MAKKPEQMEKSYYQTTVYRPIHESVKSLNENGQDLSVRITADTKIPLDKLPVKLLTENGIKPLGAWRLISFEDKHTADEHLILIKGDISGSEVLPLRVHSSFIVNEIFHLDASDDRAQLHAAMEQINEYGRGMIIYINQEGAGNRLSTVVAQLALTNQGLPMPEAFRQLGVEVENRSFQIATDVLKLLQVKSPIALMTNNVNKRQQLAQAGFNVVPYHFEVKINNPLVESYLQSKKKAGIYTQIATKGGE